MIVTRMTTEELQKRTEEGAEHLPPGERYTIGVKCELEPGVDTYHLWSDGYRALRTPEKMAVEIRASLRRRAGDMIFLKYQRDHDQRPPRGYCEAQAAVEPIEFRV